jgi:sigma-B regulation protein RsbU (phosphoserine phosphatase)
MPLSGFRLQSLPDVETDWPVMDDLLPAPTSQTPPAAKPAGEAQRLDGLGEGNSSRADEDGLAMPAELDSPEPDQLSLTDFLDLGTLQEIQDSFASLAAVRAHITDADGRPLTQPAPTSDFLRRQRAIAAAEAKAESDTSQQQSAQQGPAKEGREYVAPIIVNNQRLGLLRMTPPSSTSLAALGLDEQRLQALAEKFNLDAKTTKQLLQHANKLRASGGGGAGGGGGGAAAIQFLYILANAIARLCYQEFQLRQRVNELTAVYNVSTMLADARDLSSVLDRTVKVVCDVMDCKAASIRLVDEEHDELVIRAVHNLSAEYLNKGRISLSQSRIDHVALSPKGYEYVRDMKTDPRVRFPKESEREGIVSMLSVGMRYKGKAIGVLRVYTEKEQPFSQLKIDLLKAVAAQAAAAIENARLASEIREAERLEEQVAMAASVQQRMIPALPPKFPAADLAAVYVPCYELGGDFYDFISLGEEDLGMTVADVSGKGVAASLIMAAVRAALRAQADNVYYLYEVVRRINVMLCRDTKATEFVTLFYGVLDAPTRRLTYCNAGHPPPMLLRPSPPKPDGTPNPPALIELGSDDMVLGVDESQPYRQHIVELQKGDTLLIYTDGLPDAMNFKQETFGRQRLLETFRQAVANHPATEVTGMAETIAQNILWELRKYVGMAKRTDDITMIVARIR